MVWVCDNLKNIQKIMDLILLKNVIFIAFMSDANTNDLFEDLL